MDPVVIRDVKLFFYDVKVFPLFVLYVPFTELYNFIWGKILGHNSRVPDQNGVSLLYIMLEIHHSG